MTVRVGINGFGRIGRNFLRAARNQGTDIEVVAVNDLTSAETLAHLLRYDSTHGRFPGEIQVAEGHIVIDGRRITVLAEREPKALPWGGLGVDVVIESTGLFTTRQTASAHLSDGANRVIVSAPAADVDATFVIGVNSDQYDPDKHVVVSNASCTTNCFVPMVKVIDDAFHVVSGLM
ncbi:MAG TPA: glyceraldehyde 3-phosphate dehydrogenase NAD-binding domain-containing protein, partial [Acidimicrobiales bacterium]|nr:glyceraldehyde 3-phosphate dehydrogenase NAD-binding domain-containing protein [Acidimicrobiales bacterium]